MGNSSSKDKKSEAGSSRPSTGEGLGPSLDTYPSFSKSDTKESSRSFRSSLLSKIPGSNTESPRGSFSNLSRDSSAKSATSSAYTADRDAFDSPFETGSDNPSPTTTTPPDEVTSQSSNVDIPRINVDRVPDEHEPPPSPSQSAFLGSGHSGVEKAQQSGEVGNVSDAAPTQTAQSFQLGEPGPSILKIPEDFHHRKRSKSKQRSVSTDGALDINDVNVDEFIGRLLDAGYAGKVTKSVCLKNAEITAICIKARNLLLEQPSLLELSPPVKIVGDIHGQYTDLLRMFEMCGFPPQANFLFMGDYVDRGKQSLETILLLLCYKIKYPNNFFLLRGNHESANVTRIYGFYDECKRRTNVKIWKTFIDCFNCLPIASIVASKIFCVHGGLSPQLEKMDDIRGIKRPTDVPDYGLLNDLLWSDPAEIDTNWEPSERGVSYCFGKQVVLDCLQKFDFDLVCRAHMVVEDGYEFFGDRSLVTVFSAPNYCGEFDNWGAVMAVSEELLCSFELLKPLDSNALKSHIKKGRKERLQMLNSPPANQYPQSY